MADSQQSRSLTADERKHEVEQERDQLRQALHVLRYGMARATGNDLAADYIVNLIDTTVEQVTGRALEPCDRDEQYARAEAAEAELSRLRAGEEPGGDPAVEPTPGQWIARWNQASAEERLRVAQRVLEESARAVRCFLENHEKRLARSEPPIIGTTRIGLDVKPGFADGLTSERGSKVMPSVEIAGAVSETLEGEPGQPIVFAGGVGSRLCIDGREFAVSSERPVVVDRFGDGIRGGYVTLTLIAESVTVDGREATDVR
ncbi:hypothetical protein JL475_00620 [Streptomyces sp. M2CJ-2]|uniref:hypothetical protein n=1 Tax=Streptomyces sp. M2CJ-2 TaxID=2803948 RepID=UPI001922621F|nr:hypothetical protein [Streptomyces sp. M2CJ-2]MBL3664550.1 hypothetical protein [Streptomyces sp. M2CJ-2]